MSLCNRLLGVACAALALQGAPLRSQAVVKLPCVDSKYWELTDHGTFDYNQTWVQVGLSWWEYVGAMKFDLRDIPAGSVLLRARLQTHTRFRSGNPRIVIHLSDDGWSSAQSGQPTPWRGPVVSPAQKDIGTWHTWELETDALDWPQQLQDDVLSLRFDRQRGTSYVRLDGRDSGPETATLELVYLAPLEVVALTPGQAGAVNTLEVRGGIAGRDVFFYYGLQPGSYPIPGCGSLELAFQDPHWIGAARSNVRGVARIDFSVPAAAAGLLVRFQAAQQPCRASDAFLQLF